MNTAFTEREKLIAKVMPNSAVLVIGIWNTLSWEVNTIDEVRFFNLNELSALRLFRYYTEKKFNVRMDYNNDVYVSLK